MNSGPRVYFMSYLLIAINVIVVLMSLGPEASSDVGGALSANRSILHGEVWRLFTYPFVPGQSGLIALLFRFFVYYYFASSIERLWGTRRFLTLYFAAVIPCGLAAALLGVSRSGGGLPEAVLFCAFGMLFPEQQINLYFVFPVRAKTLARIVAGIYVVANLLQGNMSGVPLVFGFACATGYFFVANLSKYAVKPALRPARHELGLRRTRPRHQPEPGQLTAFDAMAAMPTDVLEKHTRTVVARRADDPHIVTEERLLIEEFIRRIDPGKAYCMPNQEDGEAGMCPICKELGVCLRKFVESRKDISKSESSS